MSNSIVSFNFDGNDVRFVGSVEKPEWVAADIVAVLYPEATRSSYGKYLDSVPLEWKGKKKVLTLGGDQEVNTLFEPGLYCLIARSNSVHAISFQRWVFEEVLPSIRKTGSYTTPGYKSVFVDRPDEYQGPISPERKKGLKPFKEKTEISEQQLRVYCFVKGCDRWLTNSEIAEGAGVAITSIRSFVLYFSKSGLFEFMETYPKHLYRFSDRAEARHPGLYSRMENAVRLLGDPLTRKLPTL